MNYVRRCMIITAANQAFAQTICIGLLGTAGENMFITGLSSTGLAPATHYITEGPLRDSFAASMSNANNLYADCLAQLPPVTGTLAQFQNLLTQSDISTENPFVAMSRLGLKLIA